MIAAFGPPERTVAHPSALGWTFVEELSTGAMVWQDPSGRQHHFPRGEPLRVVIVERQRIPARKVDEQEPVA